MSLWKLVIKEALQRQWRLLASLLALVLATGLIVVILSLNASSQQTVHGYLKNLGANMVVIPAELDLFSYYSADQKILGRVHMSESHFFKLFEADIKGIEGIDPRLIIPLQIAENRVLLTGILPEKMLRPEVKEIQNEDPWEVLADLAENSNGAVLGIELKRVMNTRKGSIINPSGREMRVLGILPKQGTIDDFRIYVHLRSLQSLFQRPSSLSEIRILYTGNKDLEKMASELEGMLEETKVITHRRMAKKQIQVIDSIRKYAFALLAIILVLGSISIGNEMFHNAHERRREIGILTALGATTKTILVVFITKAVFLAILGGLLGYGIGALAVLWLSPKFLNIHVYPSLWLIPLAVFTALVFSVLSSIVPSWRASRMDPAVILQEI